MREKALSYSFTKSHIEFDKKLKFRSPKTKLYVPQQKMNRIFLKQKNKHFGCRKVCKKWREDRKKSNFHQSLCFPLKQNHVDRKKIYSGPETSQIFQMSFVKKTMFFVQF